MHRILIIDHFHFQIFSESYQSTKIKSDQTAHKTGDESKSNPSNVVLHNDRTKKLEVNSKKTPALGEFKIMVMTNQTSYTM